MRAEKETEDEKARMKKGEDVYVRVCVYTFWRDGRGRNTCGRAMRDVYMGEK